MRRGFFVPFLILIYGCSANPKYLNREVSWGGKTPTKLDVKDVPVHGFKVRLDVKYSAEMFQFEGELLACDAERLWLLDTSDTDQRVRMLIIPLASIQRLRLQIYNSGRLAGAGSWLGIGLASSASHGIWFFGAGIAFGIAGGLAVHAERSAGSLWVPRDKWSLLYQFARFPAGLPPRWNTPPSVPSAGGAS